MIDVDKNVAYPTAIEALKDEESLSQTVALGPNKYLNNAIEQDHRNVKRTEKLVMGFKFFNTVRRKLRGIEAMSMIRKGQVNGIGQRNSVFSDAGISGSETDEQLEQSYLIYKILLWVVIGHWLRTIDN